MRISDWSSDVCSSDLHTIRRRCRATKPESPCVRSAASLPTLPRRSPFATPFCRKWSIPTSARPEPVEGPFFLLRDARGKRSEEHTSELQSLMRISYAVFCLKKKKINNQNTKTKTNQKNTVLR